MRTLTITAAGTASACGTLALVEATLCGLFRFWDGQAKRTGLGAAIASATGLRLQAEG
jgi:hypothetical protein